MQEDPCYPHLETPAVLIDLNKLEQNIKDMQKAADDAGIKYRPHTKVHQCLDIARMQLEAGAQGIEVGPISQAEPMADGGINDILIAHPFYCTQKSELLRRLLARPNLTLTIVVDMVEQGEAIGEVARTTGRTVPVLIKLETGIDRYGVLPGEPALKLAKGLAKISGIEVKGVYAHEVGAVPTEEGIRKCADEQATTVCETANLIKKEGFDISHVSVGASPTHFATCQLIKEGKFPEITEIHSGNRVIGDLRYGHAGGNTREGCALSVLVGVMSTSHERHVIVDSGWKTLGAEVMFQHRDKDWFLWNGFPSYGEIEGRDDLWLGRLAAETGWVYYKNESKKNLKIGDRLQIVPNSANLVVNLHDVLYGVRDGHVERVMPVTGRGKGT